MGNKPVLIIVTVIAVLVAVIALILAIVAMNKGGKQRISVTSSGGSGTSDGQTGGGTPAAGQGNDDKIWQLSFEHTGNNYGYIDDASGELRGFQIDLASTVCQIAGKSCQMVYDSPPRCWESQPGARPQGGDGLFAQYYDGCVGWVQSFDRPRTFKFTTAYSYPIKTVFMVKKGNPGGFTWTDLTGKTIGFVNGWAYDEHCIAREKDQITGWDLTLDQIVRYPGREQLYDGLFNDEVHAIFDNAGGWIAGDSAIDVVSNDILSCARDGLSVMMRKDNQMDTWWNPAFETLKTTTQWRSICNDLLDEHGHRGGPQPADFCVDY
ncbi:uncharacterized protein [Amphiura filiformis]|uniref:uncharacterized protein isoform X2 n=1 Tax=Amphiura filiformis TaxID=82378 RepID=UPI003B21AE8D